MKTHRFLLGFGFFLVLSNHLFAQLGICSFSSAFAGYDRMHVSYSAEALNCIELSLVHSSPEGSQTIAETTEAILSNRKRLEGLTQGEHKFHFHLKYKERYKDDQGNWQIASSGWLQPVASRVAAAESNAPCGCKT